MLKLIVEKKKTDRERERERKRERERERVHTTVEKMVPAVWFGKSTINLSLFLNKSTNRKIFVDMKMMQTSLVCNGYTFFKKQNGLWHHQTET